MSKKEDILKGGLNALFGGSPSQEEEPEQQEQETQEVEATPLTDGEESDAEQQDTTQEVEDIIDTIQDEELRAALHKRRMKGRGRPKKHQSGMGVANGYGRVTTIVNLRKMDKLRYIALKETLTIKEVLDAAFDVAIERYEEKRGKIVLPQDTEARKAKIKGLFRKRAKR